MKKVKVLLVGILTLVLSLFCLVGCFETGKYEAVSYKAGPVSLDVASDDASYIELKSDKTAVMSINIVIGKLEGTGTWEKGDEDKEVDITIEGVTYSATIDGNTMTIDIFGTQLILEK